MANIYNHITTATTTTITSRPCTLHTVTLNEATTNTVTINDGTTAVAIIASTTAAQTFVYDIDIKTSLNIVTAGNDDITVSYSPAVSS